MLLPGFFQAALQLGGMVVQLRMALLAVGQLHVKLVKKRFGRDPALLQIAQLRGDLRHVGIDLPTAGAGLFGQLGQALGFHLQAVGAVLAFC